MAAPDTGFLGDFIAGYVRASGRPDVPPVGLWPSDEPWVADVRRHLAPGGPPTLADDVAGPLGVVLGVPPWGWHPRVLDVDGPNGRLTVTDDPGNVDVVRACRRLAPDGVGLFVVAPGFALRPGQHTAFPTLARLGIHAEAIVELPRGLFRPDSGSGRWLMAFGRRPPGAPVAGPLTADPRTAAALLDSTFLKHPPATKEPHAHQPTQP